jgi:DNA-binding transcriptional ArsR family regulator
MAGDQLSITFAALADPTRRAILARLSSGAASVSELAAPFDISLPAVTKHLKVLQRAGLISQGREAQWRPCRLEAKPMRDAAQWMESYREHWERRLVRLDDFLHESTGRAARRAGMKK